ncbi:MAG TPA: hypothetical protein VNS61_19045, partial [Caldimonas sp.]|nr:hypothetical protein [Caldimonas sp.]
MGRVAHIGTLAAARVPDGAGACNAAEPLGVAQGNAERRLNGVDAPAADLFGEAIHRRAQIPRLD